MPEISVSEYIVDGGPLCLRGGAPSPVNRLRLLFARAIFSSSRSCCFISSMRASSFLFLRLFHVCLRNPIAPRVMIPSLTPYDDSSLRGRESGWSLKLVRLSKESMDAPLLAGRWPRIGLAPIAAA